MFGSTEGQTAGIAVENALEASPTGHSQCKFRAASLQRIAANPQGRYGISRNVFY